MLQKQVVFILAAILGLIPGFIIGVFGGGGALTTIPILAYVVGLPGKEAIATTQIVVLGTSLSGMIRHARAGNVQWKDAMFVVPIAIISAFIGSLCAKYVPAPILLLTFVFFVVIAGSMMRGTTIGEKTRADVSPKRLILTLFAFIIGQFITGLIGASGGFILVPIFSVFLYYSMQQAVGTALLIIVFSTSATGFGYSTHTTIHWSWALGILLGSTIAAWLASGWVQNMDSNKLKKAFSVFVFVMGGIIVARELPQLF